MIREEQDSVELDGTEEFAPGVHSMSTIYLSLCFTSLPLPVCP